VLRLFQPCDLLRRLCEMSHEDWASVSFQHLFDPMSLKIMDVTLGETGTGGTGGRSAHRLRGIRQCRV